jgi:hypothetical protein
MAEFWYYSLKDDWWTILEVIVTRCDLRFAVDRPYNSPNCEYYSAVTTELRTLDPPVSRVYLLGATYSRNPVFMRRQESGALSGSYFIDISRGGPCVDLIRSGEIEERGTFWIAEGWLSLQKRYWNDSLTQPYATTRELKDAFGAIKRTLQGMLLERTVAGRRLWVSPKACELFETGKAAFPVDGKCYSKDGEIPPPTVWRHTPIILTR